MASSLWPAVYSLRNAESLANLATVTGPSDAPPTKPEEQESWVKDWLERARAALKSAADFTARAASETTAEARAVLRDRAQRISASIGQGIKNIKQVAKNIGAEMKKQVEDVHKTARSVFDAAGAGALAFLGGEAALLVLAVVGAVWYFGSKGK